MSVTEIETAIMNLPVTEVGELITWLDEYYASLWDQEIEDDVNAGRFDGLLAEINEAINGSGQVAQEASSNERIAKRKSTKKPQRQATLTAIQRGKYIHVSSDGSLLPSEIFAISKSEEKTREERRWVS